MFDARCLLLFDIADLRLILHGHEYVIFECYYNAITVSLSYEFDFLKQLSHFKTLLGNLLKIFGITIYRPKDSNLISLTIRLPNFYFSRHPSAQAYWHKER